MGETNIRALAKELNLSIGTVSKALRDSYEISAETKRKVLALAQALNYTPNPYASSLRRKKSNTIAVVVPEVADSFFSLAIKGIEIIAQEKNYHVLVYLTYESFAKEQSILNDFKSGRVDGILMSVSSETSHHSHIDAVRDKSIPIVFFDRVLEKMPTTKIITDDFDSSYKATDHLLQLGCQHIVFLSISRYLSINNKRIEGYKQALTDHNRQIDINDIILCTNDDESNYQLIYKYLKQRKNVDGIIASVEKLVTPVYLVCKKLNLNIPKQVKVVGFSNLPTAPILNPSLTTITQPAFEMGKTAASVLLKALVKRSDYLSNETITIPSTLFIRASTHAL